jgi:endonuclease/exonuclease/phosphatase (EEP) superfamily protein YafD
MMVFHVRASLFSYPQLFFMSLLLLVVSYWVGLMVELRQVTAPRLPPFAPKSAEEAVSRRVAGLAHGWLLKS